MRRIASLLAVTAFAGCVDSQQPTLVAYDGRMAQLWQSPGYVIDTLPSLAGGTSRGSSINDHGRVAGFSTTSTGMRRAALWKEDGVHNLGTLGVSESLRSTVQWQGQNNTGMVVGISQTDTAEAHGESWSCAPFLGVSGKICHGFVWENGIMRQLPTLGGPNGYATAVNDRGEVVGWAETMVRDSTCNSPQVFRFRAVLWNAKTGTKRELRPFQRDATSAATAINGRGQVVGISGDCDIAVGNYSARHAVMWDNGRVVEIPHLGGEIWHTPTSINDHGHVVGFSNPEGVVGRTLLPRAFLWKGGKKSRDLGLLQGDDNAQALSINNRGQVVGVSCAGDNCRAFIWEKGVLRDLKQVVAPDFPGVFGSARSINDRGQITGHVVINGGLRAYVATPR